MTQEPLYIPIQKVDAARHAYLGLEGTILLCGERRGATDYEWQIPIELVTISTAARFKGKRLIAALLCLLGPLLLAAVVYGLAFGSRGVEAAQRSIAFAVFSLAFLTMFLIGFILFLVLLILFFRKVPTVRLSIAPSGGAVEFYKHRRDAHRIEAFTDEIRRRQVLIDEAVVGSVAQPVGLTTEHSVVPRLAAWLWLAFLPALLTKRLVLLLLPVLVLVWFTWHRVRYWRQPTEYRRAVRSSVRGEFDDAIGALRRLRRRLPEYLPASLLLVEVFTRADRFDEALETASSLADVYPDLARQMQSGVWLFKRIHQRRRPADAEC